MKEIECKKCGHKWIPRVEEPRQCPYCKNYLSRVLPEVTRFMNKMLKDAERAGEIIRKVERNGLPEKIDTEVYSGSADVEEIKNTLNALIDYLQTLNK